MSDRTISAERQQFWRSHRERARAQGMSISAYAAANDLAPWSLYKLQRSGRASSAPSVAPKFVRLEARPTTPLPCRAHLRNGVTVELGVGAGDLGAVLRELAALS